MTKRSPFRYFKTWPEVIRLAVMKYARFPLSLRNVEDLLHEPGIDICHETVRFWWNRFRTMFAAEIRKRRVEDVRSSRWRWQLDEVFVKINGEQHYLWRAVDHEVEVLESFATKRRDKKAALIFLKKSLKRHGDAREIVTDCLRSYGAALRDPGAGEKQETRRWANNRGQNSHQPFRRRERAMLRFRRKQTLQNLHLCAPQSLIFSTRNAASPADRISRPTAPLLSPSGVKSAPLDAAWGRGNRDEFELV